MSEHFKLDFVHPNRIYHPIKYINGRVVTHSKQIGGGTYGEVHLGELNNSNLAIKRNIIEKSIDMMGSLRELDILNRCKHPFIVDLIAIFLSNPFKDFEMAPIMQFETKDGMVDRDKPVKVLAPDLKEDPLFFGFEAASYDFQTFIHECENKTWPFIKKAMVQLLIAMKWLKAKGIIHRDLKPSNLLWQKDGSERFLKICDFGMSKNMYETGSRSPRVVTSWYRAPEISFGFPYSYPSDMWSVGCILYEIITQRPLNFGIRDQDNELLENSLCIISEAPTFELVSKLNKVKIELNPKIYAPRRNVEEILNSRANNNLADYFSNFDKDGLGTRKQFADLLNNILVLDPQKRYTPEQCLEHPFFYSFRDYVKQIEVIYPPIPITYEQITIVECKDRKMAAHFCYKIFDDQEKFAWYKPQIIFHTLEIYDKYLSYMKQNGTAFCEVGNTPEECSYESEKTSSFKILICLYICIKYFTITKVAGSFMDILAEKFHTPEYLKLAKDFESGLIINLLKYQIYRPTILEASDYYKMIPNKANIKYMLMYYGSLKGGVYSNYRDLFPDYQKFEAQKMEERRLRLFQEAKAQEVQQTFHISPNSFMTPTVNNNSFPSQQSSQPISYPHFGQQTSQQPISYPAQQFSLPQQIPQQFSLPQQTFVQQPVQQFILPQQPLVQQPPQQFVTPQQPVQQTITSNFKSNSDKNTDSFTPIGGTKDPKMLLVPKNISSLKERQMSISSRPVISIIHTTQSRYTNEKVINPNTSPENGSEVILDTEKIITDGTISPLIHTFSKIPSNNSEIK